MCLKYQITSTYILLVFSVALMAQHGLTTWHERLIAAPASKPERWLANMIRHPGNAGINTPWNLHFHPEIFSGSMMFHVCFRGSLAHPTHGKHTKHTGDTGHPIKRINKEFTQYDYWSIQHLPHNQRPFFFRTLSATGGVMRGLAHPQIA